MYTGNLLAGPLLLHKQLNLERNTLIALSWTPVDFDSLKDSYGVKKGRKKIA